MFGLLSVPGMIASLVSIPFVPHPNRLARIIHQAMQTG